MTTAPTLDWTAIGTAIASVGMVAGGIWAVWQNNLKKAAQNRAEIAEADAGRTVADAQQTVYKLLNERVATLENEMRTIRGELADERKHSRRLEVHICRLENLMRKAGIEPPPIEGGDPTTPGLTT